jgi:hypothetical protein
LVRSNPSGSFEKLEVAAAAVARAVEARSAKENIVKRDSTVIQVINWFRSTPADPAP